MTGKWIAVVVLTALLASACSNEAAVAGTATGASASSADSTLVTVGDASVQADAEIVGDVAQDGFVDSVNAPSPDTLPPTDATDDAPSALTLAFAKGVTGKWMHHQIGNCIDYEEWLLFGPLSGFNHVIVDRDYCGPHFVHTTPGTVQFMDGQVLQYGWQPKGGWHQRRHTAHIVDPMPTPWPQPTEPGYAVGKRALNRMAYVLAAAGGNYLRQDRTEQGLAANPALGVYARVFTAQIGFGKVLSAVATPTPCSMTVTLSASYDAGDGSAKASGSEIFTLPCTQSKSAMGWQLITANGFEQSQTSDAWSKFFEKQGLWTKHKAMVANEFYNQFRPILWFEAGKPQVLIHDNSQAWYHEFLSDPPTTVP